MGSWGHSAVRLPATLVLADRLLTLCLFYLVAGLHAAGKREAAEALARPMRVLIMPMYIVWMLLTMAHVAIAGPVACLLHSPSLCQSSSWSRISLLTSS